MKNITFWKLMSFYILYAKFACSKPPNIIFITGDDLGWNDVSFHGSLQIPTPNIDTLAYSGIILNNYYVQPLCTPSRGSLMTGKYAIKLGLQHYVISSSEPWGLSLEEVLLPQYLKEFGYATHGVGKWHLGFFHEDYIPTNRGFDSFLGYWTGKEDYYTHCNADDGFSGLDFHDGKENVWNYTGYYATEAFTDKAIDIIQNHDPDKPLFLYLSHQALHAGNSYSPLQAPKEYTDYFWYIEDETRRIFAGMGLAMDLSIGKVIAALDEYNMLENSIVVFSTDNGGAVEGIDHSTGSNWPLRGSKYNLWEGGIRGTAFIWSPLLENAKGSIFNGLMHISDWLPTLYAAAGGDPAKLGSIDGFNFWPTFSSNSDPPRNDILLNIDPAWQTEAIRKGQYKLLKGSVFDGNFDGWYSKEGKKIENYTSIEDQNSDQEEKYQMEYKKLLKESEVYRIIHEKKYLNRDQDYCHSEDNGVSDVCENASLVMNSDEHIMRYLTLPVKVGCGEKPQNTTSVCEPLKEYCLFDIEKDPCEYNNLASNLPNVVEDLKELLEDYRKQAVPMRNKPADPNSNPKFHGYAWVSWIQNTDDNVS